MSRNHSTQPPRPLRVMFVHTYLPVGGAETLLVNLIRRLDREFFEPELCCLKGLGPLGEVLANEIPVHSGLLRHKYDLRVFPRLVSLLRKRKIDAVVTVGAGDRMFWGRLAAYTARVPVVLTALHSTGWPDCINRLNRMLTPITDGFIAVADEHGRYLEEQEGFPAKKIFVVPNGIDVHRFAPQVPSVTLREEIGIPPSAPVAGIVAALRPEKNHHLFLRVARRVQQTVPDAHFIVVGDGPLREELERQAEKLELQSSVHWLGTRSDIPDLLALMDTVVLTSQMEANPVSILEALSMEKPFVAPDVGSIGEMIINGKTGVLTPPGDEQQLAAGISQLLRDPQLAQRMGQAGRARVLQRGSLESMVEGYQALLEEILHRKRGRTVTRNRREQPQHEALVLPCQTEQSTDSPFLQQAMTSCSRE